MFEHLSRGEPGSADSITGLNFSFERGAGSQNIVDFVSLSCYFPFFSLCLSCNCNALEPLRIHLL